MKRLLSITLCLVLILTALYIPVSAEESTYKVEIGNMEQLEYTELDTVEFEATITGGTEDDPAYFANHAVYIGRDLGHMTNNGPEVEVISFEELSQGDSEIPLGQKIKIRAKLGKTALDSTKPYDAYIVIEYEANGNSYYEYSAYKLKITPEGWTAPEIISSTWATTGIGKAIGYGLVTDSISGDFTKPITREEFAELAVRLYEVYTGKKADSAPESTFTDCINPEVLKAYDLGIVSGVGNNKFDPKALTNREQIATMMKKAAGVMKPDGDFSTKGAPSFADEKQMSKWALENIRFMAKAGFISGMGKNAFSPKGTCTREMAVLIAVKVYEYYKK